jgi:carbonic anhydrase
MPSTAADALERLKAGNQRFVANLASTDLPPPTPPRLVLDAHPYAIILTCADARVPPEIIFDETIGNLFVIRVAGNVAGGTQIGSVEFAASAFGVRLVVVMGHTGCAAIEATLTHIENRTEEPSPSIRAIIDLIRPAITPAAQSTPGDDRETITNRAIAANVNSTAARLRACLTLKPFIENESLTIIGARYDIATGRVAFDD